MLRLKKWNRLFGRGRMRFQLSHSPLGDTSLGSWFDYGPLLVQWTFPWILTYDLLALLCGWGNRYSADEIREVRAAVHKFCSAFMTCRFCCRWSPRPRQSGVSHSLSTLLGWSRCHKHALPEVKMSSLLGKHSCKFGIRVHLPAFKNKLVFKCR